jgi:hypothetical protein
MKRCLLSLGLVVALSACSGGIPTPGGITGGGTDVLAKYDAWLADVDELQASVEDAQRWVVDAPKELALALGLPETATIQEIGAAIPEKLAAAGITGEGAITIQVNVDIGASGAATAGTGGASAEGEAHAGVEVIITLAASITPTPEAQQLIDAIKLCLERVAGIKPRIDAILADLETVITGGRDLLASIQTDFQGLLAAQIPDYTARITARVDFLTGLSGSLGGTAQASFDIQVTVTASASGSAG